MCTPYPRGCVADKRRIAEATRQVGGVAEGCPELDKKQFKQYSDKQFLVLRGGRSGCSVGQEMQ
jgi:hypothetical protein